MNKQWVLAAALAASSLAAHAATDFTGWDLNGSSSLVNGNTIVRLTDGVGSDVGTAWVGGSYDFSTLSASTGTKFTMEFDYKATTGGDGLAVVLTSGGAAPQSPSGFLGLQGEDDALLFVLQPGVKGSGALGFTSAEPMSLSDVAQTAGSFNGLSYPGSVNLLADPAFDVAPMHARLTLQYTSSNIWLFKFQVRQPGGSAYTTVAGTSGNDLSTFLNSLSNVNIGFAASTASSAATFDIYNVNITTSSPFTPAVPEPGSVALGVAGLGVAGWMVRRRRPA